MFKFDEKYLASVVDFNVLNWLDKSRGAYILGYTP